MKILAITALLFLFSFGNQAYSAIKGVVEGQMMFHDDYESFKPQAFVDTDTEVKKAYKEMLIAQMKHEQRALEERAKVVYFTNRGGIFIFILTHIILLIGIWAAVKEFVTANKLRKTETEQSEIKVSVEGIALKTSLHGTLILSLALTLYFLFLKFVYLVSVV